MFCRISLIKQVGNFNEKLQCALDFEMWLRMLLVTDPYYDEKVLSFYRIHQESKTHKLSDKYGKELIDILELYTDNSHFVIKNNHFKFTQSLILRSMRISEFAKSRENKALCKDIQLI